MTSPTDEELMARFCRGDDGAAFEALYDRHAARVQAFLARMIADPALVEDLLQTTFASVIRSRGRFEQGTPFAAWLNTIAANVARDALRRRRRSPEELGPVPTQADVAVAPVETDFGARRAIESALSTLPESQREAVVLHKVQGWSFEEIARALQISPAAARIRAHRGYERLRELLAHLLGEG